MLSDENMSDPSALAAAIGLDNGNMAQVAFSQFFTTNGGNIFVAICLLFFAFSTILSWNLFAKLNWEYLFGKKTILVFACICTFFVFLGAVLKIDLVWELQDMFNQLMVLPNAIALFALTGSILAIANAKHDKKATDVRAEHARRRPGRSRAATPRVRFAPRKMPRRSRSSRSAAITWVVCRTTARTSKRRETYD